MKKRISINDLAYTGGIIDGEGYIGIRRLARKDRHCLYAIKVHVANTNEWLIRWLHFNYGGSIYCHHWDDGKRKDDWQWAVQTAEGAKFLRMVMPYLKIKRPQAELALKFQSRRRQGKRLSPEAVILDEADKILISSYNKKGVGD